MDKAGINGLAVGVEQRKLAAGLVDTAGEPGTDGIFRMGVCVRGCARRVDPPVSHGTALTDHHLFPNF